MLHINQTILDSIVSTAEAVAIVESTPTKTRKKPFSLGDKADYEADKQMRNNCVGEHKLRDCVGKINVSNKTSQIAVNALLRCRPHTFNYRKNKN